MAEQALIPIQDVEKMAVSVAKSGLFGMKSTDQALALMLLAQSEGIHPMTAARDYHIIQGRPALKADAMLARFQQSGGTVKWIEHTDQKVAAYFSHPSCPDPVLIDWDLTRAKNAGLGEKEMFKKYPRQMLRARVISEGVRATYPGACVGVYTPEEVEDFTPISPATPQPAQVQTQDKPKTDLEPPKARQAVQDAEIVPPAKEAKKPDAKADPKAPPVALCEKTLAAFATAKKNLGEKEFNKILGGEGFDKVDLIPNEQIAGVIFRKMRQAFDARQKVAK